MNSERRNTPLAKILTALVVAVLTLVSGIQVASGARNVKVMGQKAPAPPPACPNKANDQGEPYYKTCQVQGQVTVFQRVVDGEKGLYRARSNGKLVAWSVSLGSPTQSEQDTLLKYGATQEYPDSATAGLAVLKSAENKRFKLKAKSPIMRVDNYFGQEQIFTLEDPLPIRQGEIAALTTVTYLPFLGIKEPGEPAPLQGPHSYVASRKEENCQVPADVANSDNTGDAARKWYFEHTSPHRDVGSTKAYECVYTGERLLYKAYFVASGGNN